MNDSSSNIPYEESQPTFGDDLKKVHKDSSMGISTDGIFSIKVSEEMGLRNTLRAGLVEAQGKNTDKIPMYISWPHWLDDGIVCLFAKDFYQILNKAIEDTAIALGKTFDVKFSDIENASLIKWEDSGSETPVDIESNNLKEEQDKTTDTNKTPEQDITD